MALDQRTRIHIWYILLALWGVFVLRDLFSKAWEVERLSYSQFQDYLEAGQVDEVFIGRDSLRGKLIDPHGGSTKRFVTVRVDPQLAEALTKYNTNFSGVIESTLVKDLLSWILPTLFFFGVWYLLIRKLAGKQGLGGGFMSIGKSKAKVYVEEETKVTFEDVAGVDEAKEELKEIISFLKNPKAYSRLGGRLPKGILLVGPPGTGKTLLARAVAGEAGVVFFSISGSEFVEMFVGVGAARVRDLFHQASLRAPCIIFIDELDALGRARGLGLPGGGHDEKEQTLNQLLAELDGFDPRDGVVLLAATNRPEILDPALLRAGRFDRQILVDRPDKKGRKQILEVHLKKVTTGDDVDVDELAALTPGFSGADLANLVNEGALLATRRGAEAVYLQDFRAAIERIVAGLEKKSRLLNEKEREVVAYHEMGHALVALSLPDSDPIVKVSIIPRGIGALGYTLQRPLEDRYLMSRTELNDKMAVLLGGRAAETIVFDEVSTGAADDLSKATEIALNMVTRFGMDRNLGPVAYEKDSAPYLTTPTGNILPSKRYSDQTAYKIDQAVQEVVETAFKRAVSLLESKKELLEKAAKKLLEQETLSREDLEAIVSQN